VRSALIKADKRGAEIVLATDADEAGRKLAEQLQGLAVGVRMLRHEPTDGKDWNDALRIAVSAGVKRSLNHGFSSISLKVESLRHRP
jgi:DNA primase